MPDQLLVRQAYIYLHGRHKAFSQAMLQSAHSKLRSHRLCCLRLLLRLNEIELVPQTPGTEISG